MAVDLADLIPFLEAEINKPGEDGFPNADDDDWVVYLRNAFWEAKIFGFLEDFKDVEGTILPVVSGGDDITRDYQQLIILFAAANIITMELKATSTLFRAVAGPVEFETQNSANLLRDILENVRRKIDLLLTNLGDFGTITDAYIDSLYDRDLSIGYRDTNFWE